MKFLYFTIVLLMMAPTLAFAKSALPEINATQTIKCGYIEFEPGLMQDIGTKKFSGFDVEIVAAIAERLELKVEYTTTSGWGNLAADLASSKFDMMCSGSWIHPVVGKIALFARPHYYQPVFIVARTDDERFKKGVPDLNSADIKFVGLDGDNPVSIVKTEYPKAQILALPTMTDFSQVLVSVADKKADFSIVDAMTLASFDKFNPGKLKIVDPAKPVRVYPVAYVFRAEDYQFRDAVNNALEELILDGTVDKIFDKYDKIPNSYYRATVPYINKNPGQ